MKKESQNIEYKELWKDEYLKWICGFANANGGKLYIGINDKGDVTGLNNAKKLLEDIPNKISQMLSIVCDVNLKKKGQKEYIEIIVEKSEVAVNYKGEYHYRTGSTKQLLIGQALNDFLYHRSGKEWDAEIVDKIKYTDLDKESFDIFRREALRSKRMTKKDLGITNKQLLEKLNLIKNNKLTRAAILLFHREPHKFFKGAVVRIGLFNGSELLYDDEVYGSLMMQADRLIDLIFLKYQKVKISYHKYTRVEEYQYPKDAIREAVFNALIHSDYNSSNNIQIRVNDDELWISNNCIMPENWQDIDLYKSHKSIPLNPLLANTFYRAGFIEQWGRGIQRICAECKDMKLKKPEFNIHPHDFMIIFKANYKYDYNPMLDEGTQNVPINVPLNVPLNLSDVQKKVYEEILNAPNITREELSEKLGVAVKTISRAIQVLKDSKKIKRIGSKKTGHWEIIK